MNWLDEYKSKLQAAAQAVQMIEERRPRLLRRQRRDPQRPGAGAGRPQGRAGERAS